MTSLGEFEDGSSYTFDMYKTDYCVFLEEDDIHSGSIFNSKQFVKHFKSNSKALSR